MSTALCIELGAIERINFFVDSDVAAELIETLQSTMRWNTPAACTVDTGRQNAVLHSFQSFVLYACIMDGRENTVQKEH